MGISGDANKWPTNLGGFRLLILNPICGCLLSLGRGADVFWLSELVVVGGCNYRFLVDPVVWKKGWLVDGVLSIWLVDLAKG